MRPKNDMLGAALAAHWTKIDTLADGAEAFVSARPSRTFLLFRVGGVVRAVRVFPDVADPAYFTTAEARLLWERAAGSCRSCGEERSAKGPPDQHGFGSCPGCGTARVLAV